MRQRPFRQVDVFTALAQWWQAQDADRQACEQLDPALAHDESIYRCIRQICGGE